MYEASSSASIRWKFCTMSTKLNRGCTPSSSAISPSSRSRSTSRTFLPVSRWSTTEGMSDPLQGFPDGLGGHGLGQVVGDPGPHGGKQVLRLEHRPDRDEAH